MIADFVKKEIFDDEKETLYKITSKEANGIFMKQFKNKANVYILVRRGKIHKIRKRNSKKSHRKMRQPHQITNIDSYIFNNKLIRIM